MRRLFLTLLAVFVPVPAVSLADHTVDRIVERLILPGYARLEHEALTLADAAQDDCTPDRAALIAAYHDTFDAWIAVSHLRFGPSEVDNRAFAIAFWPDPRGKTSKSLSRLIAGQDPVVDDPAAFKTVSVAARGVFAMERLLFDPAFKEANPEYACRLLRAITLDIHSTSRALHDDWRSRYADQMIWAGRDGRVYPTLLEAEQELLKALSTGLQFTSELRLGRPLGTFERPRPKRAEAWLSGRSLQNVVLSLETLRVFSAELATSHPRVAAELDSAFSNALSIAESLSNDPIFAGVATPQGRLEVEILQQRVDGIRQIVRDRLAPALGIGQGFNALDGD